MKIHHFILSIALLTPFTNSSMQRLKRFINNKPALVALAGFAVTARKIMGDKPLSNVVRDTPTLTKLAGSGALCVAGYKIIRFLLDVHLSLAIYKREPDNVKTVLAIGGDPNYMVNNPACQPTSSPLIAICRQRPYNLDSNTIAQRVEIAQLLIAHRANIDCEDEDGHSPLVEACAAGDLPLVKSLIKSRADVNYRSKTTGNTPLSKTMCTFISNDCDQQAQNIFNLLVDHNADVHVKYQCSLRDAPFSLLDNIVRRTDLLQKEGRFHEANAMNPMIDSVLNQYDWESLKRVCEEEKGLDFNELSKRLNFKLIMPLIMELQAVDKRAKYHDNHDLCPKDPLKNPDHKLYDKNIIREVMGYL